MSYLIPLTIASLYFLNACATQAPKSDAPTVVTAQPIKVQIPEPVFVEPKPVEPQTKSSIHVLAKTRNPLVDKWIQFYAKSDASRFQRHINRAAPFEKVVKNILKSKGLPTEIFYLGIVESGYRTDARSHAQAVGVWQFIKGTGKRYGLKMNSYVDERRDPYRSTEAAALYLKDLYNVFNSWELALAAYNAGEGRILRAVMAGKTRDFWELADRGYLPEETLNYVPKFIAAAVVGENLEKYGLSKNPASLSLPDLEIVEVPHSTRLSTIANSAGIPVEILANNNPQLLRGITPPFNNSYHLWVPRKHIASVQVAVSQMPNRNIANVGAQIEKQNSLWKKPKGIAKSSVYRVKKGDSLEKISEKFKVSVDQILRNNKKVNSKIYAGELIKLPR